MQNQLKGHKYQVQDRRRTRPGVPGTGPGGDLVMAKEYQATKDEETTSNKQEHQARARRRTS